MLDFVMKNMQVFNAIDGQFGRLVITKRQMSLFEVGKLKSVAVTTRDGVDKICDVENLFHEDEIDTSGDDHDVGYETLYDPSVDICCSVGNLDLVNSLHCDRTAFIISGQESIHQLDQPDAITLIEQLSKLFKLGYER